MVAVQDDLVAGDLAAQALIACYAEQKATVDLTCAQAAVAEVQAE